MKQENKNVINPDEGRREDDRHYQRTVLIGLICANFIIAAILLMDWQETVTLFDFLPILICLLLSCLFSNIRDDDSEDELAQYEEDSLVFGEQETMAGIKD